MMRSIFCALLFLLSGRLTAQTPFGIFISPTDGQTVSNPSITITWKGCSDTTLTTGETSLNGAALTTTAGGFTSQCPDISHVKKYSAPATLRVGPNTIGLHVCDDNSNCGNDSITVYYNGPAVSVTPDGASPPLVHRTESGTYRFKVTNSGYQAATATFSNSCDGVISCSAPPDPSSSALLAPGDTTVVIVSYSADTVGIGHAKLRATYNEYPGVTDTGYVTVTVDPARTRALFTSPDDGDVFSTPNITITWKGCSDAPQTTADTYLNGNLLVTTQGGGALCQDNYVGKNYSASATLVSGSDTLHIHVCDAVTVPCGDTTIIVTYSPPSVSVTPDGATAPSVVQGFGGSYAFKVKNTGVQSATAAFSYVCTAQLSSCSVSASSASIAAGDSVTVTVSYTAAAAGNGQATLRATYNEYPGTTDTGYVNVTVISAPSVSVTPDGASAPSVIQGASSSYGFKVRNTGGPSATAAFSYSCAPELSSCSVAPTSAFIAAGDSVTVTVSYTGAAPGTGRATLTATYNEYPSTTDDGYVNVTVLSGPAVSVTPDGATAPSIVQGASSSYAFKVKNTGGVSATAVFSYGCSGLTSCSVSPTSQSISAGDSSTVTLSYTGGTVGPARATLFATYSEFPAVADSGYVTLSVLNPPSAPTGNFTSHTDGQTVTSSSITIIWKGCSNNTQDTAKTFLNGALLTSSQQTDACTGFAIGKTYTASGTLVTGANTLSLKICDVNGCGTKSITVNYVAPGLTVVVAGKNPRNTTDKAGCLTIAAGQNAAYECSDLRVVHPLPPTITMDRARGPALIYNSRHANPVVLLAADVTWSGATPTVVRAVSQLSGQAATVKDFAWNPACANKTCRIVVPISTTQPTESYVALLLVSIVNGTTTYATSDILSDTVVVVNRASSPFGAGWWLDGLESLLPVTSTSMLWVGGDGSSRLYTQTADANTYTVSPSYDRPDTLKRDLGAQTWRRLLGDSAYVEFNSSGQQTQTVNALGWKTTFAYTGAKLDSITLPVPAGMTEVRRYRFRYSSSSLLDSVQAPSASFPRTTRVIHDGSARIDSIIDPDSIAVRFGYDGFNRLTSRRNKMGDTTYFAYDDGGALKQSSLSMVRTDGSGAITTNFRAAETRSVFDGSDVPTPLAAVYTHIDGPRGDVADTTNFMVNRFGAPDTVTNALGQRTRLQRANSTFPSLVTKMITSGGFETRAFFNARGLPDSTVAVNPYGNDSSATTRFTWNPVWNQVDSVVGPTGDRTRTFFKTSRAIPDSMRTGTNVNRRVVFAYTADNQVRSVKVADGGPDSVVYDNLGNAVKTYSPVGRAAAAPYFIEFIKDAIGRDVLVKRPISGSVTDSTRVVYDVADRVAKTILYGPARPYSFVNVSFSPDTAAVVALERADSTAYDAEGNLVYKRSLSEPDYNSQLNEHMTYDAAGRLKTRKLGSGPDSLVYDSAGNVVRAKYRSGLIVTQSYDVLNRLVQRIVPSVDYPSVTCDIFFGSDCDMKFPFFPNKGDSLRIPADTAAFAYDAAGHMTNASNRYARTRRSYFLSGALESDTTTIGSYSSPRTDDEKNGQKYSYDLAGRRKSMIWGPGLTTYAYNDFGALSQITDPNSNAYRFTYSLQSQLDSLLLGSGVREKRVYDDDGRLVFRNRVSDFFPLLVSDSLSYDNADHVVRAREEGYHRAADRALISYDGLGAVLARENANFTGGANVEEFRNDAFGNVVRKKTRSTAGLINTAPFTLGYDVTGALRTWNTTLTNPTQSQYDRDDDLGQSFLNGQLIKQHQVIKDPDGLGIGLTVGARHYYGADDKLMVVQRYSKRPLGVSDGTWEEYWYDALGRRVLTRVRRNGGSPYDATHDPLCHDVSGGVTCRSFKERVWWDGDQALVEERAPDGTSDVSNSGTIMNIHALTLDEPLGVVSTNPSTQTRIINYNWRGQGMSSVFPDGTGADTATSSTSGTAQINWPAIGQAQTYFTPNLDQVPDNNTPDKWMGTFIQNGQGTTGMLYRRNRYFDANTGRFTQEDPIGIAGGVNAYGFANGDPVNFSDPFGLCMPWPDCMFQGAANWGAQRGGTVGSTILNAAAATNAASEALGINDFGKAVGERDAVGIGLGLASILPVGRAGAVGKTALSALMRDVAENPKAWRTIGAFTEAATRKGLSGGLSIQRVIENEFGDRLVEHTLLDKSGSLVEQHLRPMYKLREIDIR